MKIEAVFTIGKHTFTLSREDAEGYLNDTSGKCYFCRVYDDGDCDLCPLPDCEELLTEWAKEYDPGKLRPDCYNPLKAVCRGCLAISDSDIKKSTAFRVWVMNHFEGDA